jgi:transcriptional regulator of acetoin/glycerol metabolism
VREVLAACGGSKSEAARCLGVDRTTLYRLLERLGDGVK